MNLHIMMDHFYSERFINFIYEHFGVKENTFLIITNAEKTQYVNVDEKKNVFKVGVGKNIEMRQQIDNKDVISSFVEKSDKIFFHYLKNSGAHIINHLCTTQKLYWVAWGKDYYGYINMNLYDEDTKKLGYTHDEVTGLLDKERTMILDMRARAIGKLDFICTSQVEYNIIKKMYNIKAENYLLTYPTGIDFEHLVTLDKANNERRSQEYNILIGNSGDPSNNHMEIFNVLKGFEKQNFHIYCPLSYGDSVYIQKIMDIGNKMFGGRFHGVTDFMNANNYFSQILNKMDIVVFNHNRAQGFGNICAFCAMSKKIYIKENTTTYKLLSNLGVLIEKTEEILDRGENEFFDINKPYFINNKRVIIKEFGDEKIINTYRDLFIQQ